ncbi:MAG: hypothetical protein ACFE9Z_03415 [Promethearchaeota archaeon]
MLFSIELVIAIIILVPLIIVNIMFGFSLFFQKIIINYLQKELNLEEKNKDSKNRIFNFSNTVIWITIGLIFTLTLDDSFTFGALVVFLAFRGGFTLSKRFIFGIHDIRITKSKVANKKISKIISRAVRLGIIIELLFVLIWGILYKYLSLNIKSTFGIEVNILVIILWLIGFLYGIIIAFIQSFFTKQILLKNEIGIILLLSGEAIINKIKKRTFFSKI